ncbi:sensor histidine kinase [Nocardioides panacisoli]|uniref:histidine kinase n=1 Tax=Nocardioides panacisoli TaxID=627624 RepID=A0ABP7I171_9ACTN
MTTEGSPPPADVWRDATRVTIRRVAVDVGLALVFAGVLSAIQLQMSAAMVWATLVLSLGLAVRRVSPWLVLATGVAAALIQVLTGEIAAYGDVAYAPLAFALGAHVSSAVRRTALVAAAVAVAGAGLWSGLVGSEMFDASLSAGIGMAAVTAVFIGGGWTAGFVRWQRRQAIQAQVDAAFAGAEQKRIEELYHQEQERSRIAADMHDLVAHSWAVVAAQADGARYVLREDPDRAEGALSVIGETARSAMNDVRGLLAELRGFEQSPAVAAPIADRVIDRMRRTGLVIEHARYGSAHPGDVGDAAGFVLTESLTNALKHGDRGRPVEVVEDWRDGYALRVANPLQPGAEARRGTGHGLRGMTERVAAAGGRLSAGRQDGLWIVDVRIPAGAAG